MLKVLMVESVNPMGQAFRAGIHKDDILVSYNGTALETTDALISIASQSGGDANRIELIRGSRHRVVVVAGGALGLAVVPKELSEDTYANALIVSGDANKKIQREDENPADKLLRARDMIITTAHSIEGYRVVETIEIVTAECAYGMNIFKDIFAVVRDLVGGRSKAIQNTLRDARRECLTALKFEALDAGANAVIAVDLDYSEFSATGNSMLFLVASGTAVKIEKVIP